MVKQLIYADEARRSILKEDPKLAYLIDSIKPVDAVEVVRCQNCIHAEPLDRNCELSTTHYLHCKLWRGEETKNVWHKYKKYYKDYSLVERDGYCDAGEKMDGGNDDDCCG